MALARAQEKVFSFEECSKIVAAQAAEIFHRRRCATERRNLLESLGRVLTEDIAADRDFPPFPRSARDGFACRAVDLASIPAVLRIVAEIPAGSALMEKELRTGEAAEIMTGAPLPAGADCVVMLEHTERQGDQVKVLRSAAAGENFVPAGSEGKRGEIVLARGSKIDYASIAVAAAVGRHEVEVAKPPTVAVLATGNELVEIEQTPAPHQIRNSNSYSVGAQVAAAGGTPILLPIARDSHEQIRAAIRAGLRHDLLLITGGVSVGKYDLVEEILGEWNAEIFFTGALIQPGKPAVFARIAEGGRQVYCFGLPGNPVSTMVTFEVFARPILRALAGARFETLPFAQAKLAKDVKVKAGLTRFLPAHVEGNTHEAAVRAVAWRGSGDLVARAAANCYIVVPPDREHLRAGDAVTILLA